MVKKQVFTDPSRDQIDALINLYYSGQAIQVIHTCKKLLKIHKKSLVLLNLLGVASQAIGKYEEAINSYNRAIRVSPNDSGLRYNIALAFQSLGQPDSAIKNYNKAIQIKPDYAEAYSNLGSVLAEMMQPNEAIKNYNKAIQIKPDYAEAYSNLGIALQELGRLDEAIKNYKKAIQLKPDYAEAHWNLSLALLPLGNFKQGWEKYEYGKLIKKKNRMVAITPYQPWNGESLIGKTIVVTAEQGVGDEIMFASCIPELIKKNPKQIVLECDSRLVPLLARSFTQVRVLKRKKRSKTDWLDEIGVVDFHISIGSLPRFFRQEFDDFPCRRAFIFSNNSLKAKWKERYQDLGKGIKIGISWTGGSKNSIKKSRSTTLKQWLPLFKMNAYFINLQYGEHSEELRQLEESTGIHIYDWEDADPLTDLDNQAAQISELDLVISFPNATVHLAGALGTPTWVLLPFTPDFRWVLNREDSPWYPSVKLFRQHQYEDWTKVFSQVKNKLDVLIR